METVLVIEDSRPMQRTLQRLFEADAMQVRFASDGVQGVECFQQSVPSVVILDLKLPGLQGKDLCRFFKSQRPYVPIVVLSANAEVEDKITLFDLGADDYVTKPFSPRELLARVHRAMRRGREEVLGSPNGTPHERLTFDDIEIDFTGMEAKRAGRDIPLTAQEFKLLRFLAVSPGHVFSREELLNEVWGYQNYPTTRTVDNHVLRLRQKLEPDAALPRYFITVHGAGYKFTPGEKGILRKG